MSLEPTEPTEPTQPNERTEPFESTEPTEPSVVVLESADAVADLAAELLAAAVRDAVEARGIAHVATTGGSTAPALYRRLASEPLAASIPWPALRLWWGDDRFVPRDDRDSNVRPADELLADLLPAESWRPFPVEEALAAGRDAAWCAARYSAMLRAELPLDGHGMPVFDVVLIGVGPDGHCLSIFPAEHTPAPPQPSGTRPIAIAVPAPTHIGPHVARVTLTLPVLDAARTLIVMAPGAAKAEALAGIFGTARDDRHWPAQRARRAGAIWLLDEPAAAQLPR
jgi:6-phosphogluconolactonase